MIRRSSSPGCKSRRHCYRTQSPEVAGLWVLWLQASPTRLSLFLQLSLQIFWFLYWSEWENTWASPYQLCRKTLGFLPWLLYRCLNLWVTNTHVLISITLSEHPLQNSAFTFSAPNVSSRHLSVMKIYSSCVLHYKILSCASKMIIDKMKV